MAAGPLGTLTPCAARVIDDGRHFAVGEAAAGAISHGFVRVYRVFMGFRAALELFYRPYGLYLRRRPHTQLIYPYRSLRPYTVDGCRSTPQAHAVHFWSYAGRRAPQQVLRVELPKALSDFQVQGRLAYLLPENGKLQVRSP